MIVLEGTDGVGKTSCINLLKEYNIQDRDKYISSKIIFDISLKKRAELYYEYLNKNNKVIIFLINNDKEELERRINKRSVKDKYDNLTYLYNLLYLETYLYMESNDMLNNKLYLVDVTGLTIDEQTSKIKEMLDKVI